MTLRAVGFKWPDDIATKTATINAANNLQECKNKICQNNDGGKIYNQIEARLPLLHMNNNYVETLT